VTSRPKEALGLLSSTRLLIAVALGLAGGAVAGALYGRTSETANWVTAAATVALTAFALLQLLRIEADAADARNQRRHRLQALATLARRSCQAAVQTKDYYVSVPDWAVAVSRGFGALEAQFLEVRSLGAGLGDVEGAAVKEAFDSFINAADRVNMLSDSRATIGEQDAAELQRDAIFDLGVAAAVLDRIAPCYGSGA
jgi:hypothetical protein